MKITQANRTIKAEVAVAKDLFFGRQITFGVNFHVSVPVG
jgi:hypothetical protein